MPDHPQGGVPPTLLPPDPALDELIAHGSRQFVEIASRYLDSCLCWAILAEGSLAAATADAELIAYAFARTGYHRGLDALRGLGWQETTPVPWAHEPNRGFLRCLAWLAKLSAALGDGDESDRCWALLRRSSPRGYDVLRARVDVPLARFADLVRDVVTSDDVDARRRDAATMAAHRRVRSRATFAGTRRTRPAAQPRHHL